MFRLADSSARGRRHTGLLLILAAVAALVVRSAARRRGDGPPPSRQDPLEPGPEAEAVAPAPAATAPADTAPADPADVATPAPAPPAVPAPATRAATRRVTSAGLRRAKRPMPRRAATRAQPRRAPRAEPRGASALSFLRRHLVAPKRHQAVLLLAGLAATAAALIGGTAQARVTNSLSDYDDPTGQHATARKVIEHATGIDPQQGYALLIRTDKAIAPHAPTPAVVTAAVRLLRSRPEVKKVTDYATAGSTALISKDARSTVVVAALRPMTEHQTKTAEHDLQQAVTADPLLRGHADLGGPTIGMVQVGKVTTEDLSLAEGLATPVVLALLVLVFRGVVAALLPVAGAVFTLLLTLAGLRLVMVFRTVSTGALNLSFALALGLAVDFGLLIVSRYRDEIAVHGPGPVALRRTMATAGRTVMFSGMTVGAALVTLLVFPQPYLRSMGVAGVLTASCALLFALVVLPALLTALGSRVNSLAPARWQRNAAADDALSERWQRLAEDVMRRPASLVVLAVTALLFIASPAFGIRFTGADASALPKGTSAGRVAAALARDFTAPATTPLRIVLDTSGNDPALGAYAERVAKVPGIAGVGTPFRLDAAHWEIDAVPRGAPLDRATEDTVTRVRRIDPPAHARYTGATADFLSQKAGIGARLPLAIGLLAGITVLLLFAFTGSVVLPVAALVMNTLSTGAALGFLVWAFQEGHLGQHAAAGIETTTPVLVFALAFGLSTDYSVFLLSRIREARTSGADDRTAVTEGLARTGRIVTSAALLFCVAVCALGLSRLVFVRELGLGTAFAVMIDATVVRAALVPAMMALLGRVNWWAPAFLRRLHAAWGLSDLETGTAGAVGTDAAADRPAPTLRATVERVEEPAGGRNAAGLPTVDKGTDSKVRALPRVGAVAAAGPALNTYAALNSPAPLGAPGAPALVPRLDLLAAPPGPRRLTAPSAQARPTAPPRQRGADRPEDR